MCTVGPIYYAPPVNMYWVYSRGLPHKAACRYEAGGQNRLARPGNCTLNLERGTRRPPLGRPYRSGTPPYCETPTALS